MSIPIKVGAVALPSCPVCGRSGKRIRPETIQSLIKKDRQPQDFDGYSLCLTGSCDVTYFGRQVFHKDDLTVKIWFKEQDPAVPVCYCKNVTAKDIVDHIACGCCRDMKDIQDHTGANTGQDCLTKNPAGA